jgi:hypothetical protein
MVTPCIADGRTVTEEKAMSLVAAAVSRDPARGRGLARGCLALASEARTKTHFDIAVRETHNPGCGGDPAVSPVIERYRILRKNKDVLIYDVVTDSYVRSV